MGMGMGRTVHVITATASVYGIPCSLFSVAFAYSLFEGLGFSTT